MLCWPAWAVAPTRSEHIQAYVRELCEAVHNQ